MCKVHDFLQDRDYVWSTLDCKYCSSLINSPATGLPQATLGKMYFQKTTEIECCVPIHRFIHLDTPRIICLIDSIPAYNHVIRGTSMHRYILHIKSHFLCLLDEITISLTDHPGNVYMSHISNKYLLMENKSEATGIISISRTEKVCFCHG